jgi:hypothetical protein
MKKLKKLNFCFRGCTKMVAVKKKKIWIIERKINTKNEKYLKRIFLG